MTRENVVLQEVCREWRVTIIRHLESVQSSKGECRLLEELFIAQKGGQRLEDSPLRRLAHIERSSDRLRDQSGICYADQLTFAA